MAAGLGFKDFTTGEVLTAADVDGYLMQGIWVFASTAARDAAVTAPAEGNFAFTKDTNSLWYYDGAAWVASGATGDIEGVTAGVGISGGGTSGTVTVTNSMATAIDAKGDLIVGTGADTFSKLTAGTNTYVLTADSAEATGLKWAAPSGGTASFVGVSCGSSTNPTISNNTTTIVSFNTELFDTDGFHDTSTNSSRITIPSGKAGKYLITAAFPWQSNATGFRQLVMLKNGGVSSPNVEMNAIGSSAAEGSVLFTAILSLAVSDYVEIRVYQNSGGNLIFGASNGYFQAQYLGA
jgi:hypothetical protein